MMDSGIHMQMHSLDNTRLGWRADGGAKKSFRFRICVVRDWKKHLILLGNVNMLQLQLKKICQLFNAKYQVQ